MPLARGCLQGRPCSLTPIVRKASSVLSVHVSSSLTMALNVPTVVPGAFVRVVAWCLSACMWASSVSLFVYAITEVEMQKSSAFNSSCLFKMNMCLVCLSIVERCVFSKTGRQPLSYPPVCVPRAGVEPAQVSLSVFETDASTDSAIGA